ncbi:MAG: hypothetical protein HRU38_07515 [Saccharospirillaceae bacterium]|nr:hypothetical protein [Pseudomonadales bacterium]NRB78500.1 hypothetical protein [Saccharospirillaceae bacterium]
MNWRNKVEEILADELGMLAPMVVDEILSELKTTDLKMSGRLGSKFIKLLEKKTKSDIDNPKLIRQVYKVILDLPY